MKKYKIVKSTRSNDAPPYAGPTCEAVEVTPGKIYDSVMEAAKDAIKMSEYNPVGFEVVETDESGK